MHKDQSFQLLIFTAAGNHYAIHAEVAERAIRIVETTPIPNSPSVLFGIFDLQGNTVPVISLRRLFSLDEKEIELEDMLIVLHIGDRLIALLTDHVLGIFECPKDDTNDTDELFPGLVPIEIVKWEEMLIPVVDIEKLIDEEIFHHVAGHGKNGDKEALHA